MRTMQTSLSGCFWKDVEQAEEGRGWQWVSIRCIWARQGGFGGGGQGQREVGRGQGDGEAGGYNCSDLIIMLSN